MPELLHELGIVTVGRKELKLQALFESLHFQACGANNVNLVNYVLIIFLIINFINILIIYYFDFKSQIFNGV